MSSALDAQRLRDALALAEASCGLTEPNPRVGCVIGLADGRVLGQGRTQEAGGPHAEVMALRDAAAHGHAVRGATAWVTLEPCAHHGRTPPCSDALVAAGLARVVIATEDPFKAVDGQGMARLRAAGIEVELTDDLSIRRAAQDLNIGFFSRVLRGRPWVRVKSACSLDGRTALPSGESQWITGEAARADGHAWRRRASLVLTGIGTVLADDPQLTVRAVDTVHQPRRAVVDSRLRTPASARCLDGPGTLLFCVHGAASAGHEFLAQRGAEVVALPPGAAGGVDLVALLGELAARQVNELHVEAGALLTGAWLAADLADELLVYQAPLLLADGPPMARLAPPNTLAQAQRWDLVQVNALGADLRLRLWRPASALSRWWPQATDER